MKSFAYLSAVLALGLTLVVGDAEAAKRLGGGKSSGMPKEVENVLKRVRVRGFPLDLQADDGSAPPPRRSGPPRDFGGEAPRQNRERPPFRGGDERPSFRKEGGFGSRSERPAFRKEGGAPGGGDRPRRPAPGGKKPR